MVSGYELLVALLIIGFRLAIVHQLYMGWIQVRTVANELWTTMYTVGVTCYMMYFSLSSLDNDIQHPEKILGLLGLSLCIQVFINIIVKRRKKDDAG